MPEYATRSDDSHPDFPVLSMLRDEIACRGVAALETKFPELVRNSVDFVLYPVRIRMDKSDRIG